LLRFLDFVLFETTFFLEPRDRIPDFDDWIRERLAIGLALFAIIVAIPNRAFVSDAYDGTAFALFTPDILMDQFGLHLLRNPLVIHSRLSDLLRKHLSELNKERVGKLARAITFLALGSPGIELGTSTLIAVGKILDLVHGFVKEFRVAGGVHCIFQLLIKKVVVI